MFQLGDTFLAGEQLHGKHHLWVVINDPATHGDTVLFVNVTTVTDIAEKTCILQPGEHAFIKQESCIRFASAKTALVSELDTLESSGLIIRHQPASPALVAKISAAAQASPHLSQKHLGLL